MRRYHFRVGLLTLGVLLGFGSAIARYGFGYQLGPDWRHDHRGHHGHHDCCDCGEDDGPAQSGVPSPVDHDAQRPADR